MLASLSIQNVVLIDRLNIEFQPGLCALTGETGAGKSILLDALGLALGARSESGLVRKGEDQASVTAEFHIGKKHQAHKILKDAEIEGGDMLLLRRSVSADGRSRAFINDQPVSATLLRQIGDTLLEIHGQFETQGLLNPATHRQILDDYAGVNVQEIRAAWNEWKKAQDELIRLKTEAEKSRAEETYLRQAVEDLDALEPQPGEEQTLSASRERLMHREKVMQALDIAEQALSREDDPIRQSWGALERVKDKLGQSGHEAIAALSRASVETQEALSAIRSQSADMEHNDQSLESIDERLYQLRAQARKHNCAVDDLAAMREDLARKLNLIERSDEILAAQMKIADKARQAYEAQSKKLSDARKKSAKKLDALIQKELPPLKMERATFATHIEDLSETEWGPEGRDRIRFLVSTNPGAAPGPLNKIASGGEMARFMLALKVVMAENDSGQSLIFDEADAGVGGAVADAVGERLSRLAKNNQVLVVTHAPQVAARADHHYIVKKSGDKDVKTSIIYLDANAARREEIARMLAGATITQEARAAADRLLRTGT